MSWAQGKSEHNNSVCSCVAGQGEERESEPACERGTPLTALDTARGAPQYTHQKRRMAPFPFPVLSNSSVKWPMKKSKAAQEEFQPWWNVTSSYVDPHSSIVAFRVQQHLFQFGKVFGYHVCLHTVFTDLELLVWARGTSKDTKLTLATISTCGGSM